MAENQDINALMDRINAQTEVHERYTQAFVKILTLLDHIKNEIDPELVNSLKLVSDKTIQLQEQFKIFSDSITLSEKDLSKDLLNNQHLINQILADLKVQEANVKLLLRKMELITQKNEEEEAFFENHAQIMTISVDIKSILAKHDDSIKNIYEELKKTNVSLNDVKALAEQVKFLYDSQASANDNTKHLKWGIGALFVFIAIVETLVQFNILHLTWGTK